MSPPAPAAGPAPTAPARRVDSSMSLLVDVMTNTLDEAYAERAARRAGTGAPAPAPRSSRSGLSSRLLGLAVLVLLGLLTGTAVDQVRERAAASEGVREDLAEEVRERSADSERLVAEVTRTQSEVAAVRDEALGADAAGQEAAERVRALELAAGTAPVTGPGVVLTLDDAPTADGDESDPVLRGGGPDVTRVNDRDLQAVVNGLWAAGAEAVSVNGVRLSTRAAIRSAGEAVLVDFRPLSPPYVVEAVGRPADLEVGFVDGPAGRGLQALAELTGITWQLERSDELELAAASEPALRAARPVAEADTGAPAAEVPPP